MQKSLARDNAEDPPTFQEFAEALLRHPQPDIEMDDHWRKQSAQCSFRYVHFEHVIRFEHMGAGAHAVLNQLGLWEEYGAHGMALAQQELALAFGYLGTSSHRSACPLSRLAWHNWRVSGCQSSNSQHRIQQR